MTTVALVFPNQLFVNHPVLREAPEKVLLLEDSLFFGDSRYPMKFHKQKLAYHRATMAVFAKQLQNNGSEVESIKYKGPESQLGELCAQLKYSGASRLVVAELNDFILSRRLVKASENSGLELVELASPGFLNSMQQNQQWRASRKRWFMAEFYQWQRKRLNVLMQDGAPAGGRWSYDEDNRKKLPKSEIPALPKLPSIKLTPEIKQAVQSVLKDFPDNPGSLRRCFYPTSSRAAEQWLDTFLIERLAKFGPYEDAMAAGQSWIYHGVLSPMLNTGLLTPEHVVRKALQVGRENEVPLSSIEGFVRQLIGWREFMRATYHDLGVTMRTTNTWKHENSMPDAFYTGTTGIDPIDDVISRILDTGYCHHIERLMVLGGFMFLCEIHPDEVYRWFMEMFIDSYDWVMVPNVYAMSQHADGGAITSKPYFSGSNYVLKMSNYKKGEWSIIWDALFWRWIFKNSEQLAGNPRWAMMVRNADKMQEQKRKGHERVARKFLAALHA